MCVLKSVDTSAAVGIIFYVASARIHLSNKITQWLRLQLAISVGLLPLTLLLFQNASIIAPFANLLVIPIVGFAVVPLSLLAALCAFISMPMSHVLFHFAAWILGIAWHILVWLAAEPLLAWQRAVYSWWSLAAAFVGIGILLAPRGFPARALGICWCLPLLFMTPKMPVVGTAKLTLLDVGQGLASVIQTAQHTLIFDTGAKLSANFNMGAAVVLPFLRSQGIPKVDMLIVSHGDNDHIGGAASVLKSIPVRQVVSSVPQRFAPGRARFCLAGQHWQWDGVSFRFLYPDKQHLHLDNNSSCVLRVSVGSRRLLLTGDIEKAAENFLLQHEKHDLPATVIIAPHHGSKTSSTSPFLEQVDPQYVFYSLGYLNRFHFPNAEVVQRYRTLGASALTTAASGAISITVSKNKSIKPTAYRKRIRRFWRQD